MFRFILVFLALLPFLSACVSEPAPDTPFAPGSPAVLSVKQPGLQIPPGTRFAWLPGAREYHASERLRGQDINRLIEAAIGRSLARRQLVLQPEAAGARYLLAWVAALEGDLDDETIMRRFGIVPGINSAAGDRRVEKGTLILYAVDVRNGRRVWRSAMQTLVTLNMDAELRRQRIEAAVEAMFATLPVARQGK